MRRPASAFDAVRRFRPIHLPIPPVTPAAVKLTPAQTRTLLDIARRTIIDRVRAGTVAAAAPGDAVAATATTTDDALRSPAGCFVSLHERRTHRLRGCVGQIEADRPMDEAVRSAALAVLSDPRFTAHPVTPADLPLLEVEISLLSALKVARSPLDFDPQTEGIVLSIGGRRGLFLPQVARETGWTKQQLLSRLCVEKLGYNADAWMDESAVLETFSTGILGPEPLLDATDDSVEPTR